MKNRFVRCFRVRVAVLLLTLWLTLSGVAPAGPGASGASGGRPSIVVIMADDLGWNDVGYHGSEIDTPHIDRLAKRGVRLDQYYTHPVCSPTRAAFLTGRYVIRYGLQRGVVRPWADEQHGLPPEERTIAEALQQRGYFTALTGKWHLGHATPAFLPTEQGFDHQYGFYTGMLDYFTQHRGRGLDWHRNDRPLRQDGYATNLITQETVRLIDKHGGQQPLFLYVAYNAPHGPLQAPDRYIEQYDHIDHKKRRVYAAMVDCMDDGIGRIVEAINRAGIRQNTLIVFVSDNGAHPGYGGSNEPLRGRKGTLFEGGVRVPAVAAWPGRLEGDRVVNEPIHVTDWHATFLALAGGSPGDAPNPLDGHNVWPTITDGADSPHDPMLLNVNSRRGALRDGPWKLIHHPNKVGGEDRPYALFNLRTDPRERNDLAGQHPGRTRDMREHLEAFKKQAAPLRSNSGRPDGYQFPKIWGPYKE